MVTISFQYDPDMDGGGDDSDPTGVTAEEFDRINEVLSEAFGAENIQVNQS